MLVKATAPMAGLMETERTAAAEMVLAAQEAAPTAVARLVATRAAGEAEVVQEEAGKAQAAWGAVEVEATAPVEREVVCEAEESKGVAGMVEAAKLEEKLEAAKLEEKLEGQAANSAAKSCSRPS